MEQHGLEGLLSHLLVAGENHSDYPEENNIISGYQYIRGIEILQILGLLRPAQGLEGPQCGGEPGIQRIGILCEMCLATLRTNSGGFLCNHNLTTLITVVSRDSVSPPELTTDTPVADVVGPVEISLLHTLGNQLDLTILYRFNGRFDELIHLYKPLLLYQGLNGGLAAVMSSYVMTIILNLNQQSLTIQLLYDGLSGLIAIHALILSAVFIDGSIVVHHIDDRQIMTLSNLKVVRVVSRGNLNNTGSEFPVNVGVGNNGNHTIHDRQHYTLANQMLISLILGMNGHCCIAQHGLGTGGGKGQEFRGAGSTIIVHDGVLDMPEMTGLLLILYLGVRDGGITYGTPVDDTGALVDVTFLMHLYEYFGNCLVAALIHGKTLSVPVTGGAHLLQLGNDTSAVLFLPLPGSLQELLTPQVMLVDALLLQLLDNLNLGCDGSMVCAGLPECIIALHSFKTNQDILHGIIQRMPHVQLSCNIWRGNHDSEGGLGVIHLRMKILLIQPFLIQSVLYALGVIGLCKFFAHSVCSFLILSASQPLGFPLIKAFCFAAAWFPTHKSFLLRRIVASRLCFYFVYARVKPNVCFAAAWFPSSLTKNALCRLFVCKGR